MGALCNCNERGIIESKEVILGMPGYVIMPLPQWICVQGFFRGVVDIVSLVDKILILVDKIFTFVDISSCFVDKV